MNHGLRGDSGWRLRCFLRPRRESRGRQIVVLASGQSRWDGIQSDLTKLVQGWVPLPGDRTNCVELIARTFQPKLDAAMIDWRKLKFPNENASANELHTILSEFLREGLDATDVEEQKRLQVILKRLELNRRNWSAMATVIQLEIAKDAEELSRLCWNIPLRRSHRRGLDDRRRVIRRRK